MCLYSLTCLPSSYLPICTSSVQYFFYVYLNCSICHRPPTYFCCNPCNNCHIHGCQQAAVLILPKSLTAAAVVRQVGLHPPVVVHHMAMVVHRCHCQWPVANQRPVLLHLLRQRFRLRQCLLAEVVVKRCSWSLVVSTACWYCLLFCNWFRCSNRRCCSLAYVC